MIYIYLILAFSSDKNPSFAVGRFGDFAGKKPFALGNRTVGTLLKSGIGGGIGSPDECTCGIEALFTVGIGDESDGVALRTFFGFLMGQYTFSLSICFRCLN